MNRPAARIALGSTLLVQRVREVAADWIARGRRADLTGWRASLGPLARTAGLLVGAYVAVRIVRAAPVLLWALTPAWVVAAYRITSVAPEQAPAEPPLKAPQDPRQDLARWLLQTIADRPGIHLYELYPAMRQLPGQEGRDDTALRAALRGLGVPVVRSLRVPPVEGRSGVRRVDVEALLPRSGERPGESHGDAGQDADSPALSTVGEGAESA